MFKKVFLLLILFPLFWSSTSLDVGDEVTPPLFGSERQVHLHLDEIHVSTVTLATVTSLSDMFAKHNPSEDSLFLESFQVPMEALGGDRLEYLKSGFVITASATPTAPFRIRDKDSGHIVAMTLPQDLIRHLSHISGSPTVCGSTVARGLMSLAIDGDKSIPSLTKYIPIDTTAVESIATVDGTRAHQRMLIESTKKRRLEDNDICEEIDAVFSPGGCLREATCFIKYSRKKRVEKEVCLSASKCGKRVKGTITIKSNTEFDEDYFQGECRTIVIPRFFDDCHCFLTDEGTQALNDWRNEPLPSVQCSSTSCSGKGSGDPHFTTWDGTRFSYHGECDMVMAHSKTFGGGMGLDLHIRTTIQDSYSYISSVAVKMGPNILEILANDTSYFNGDTTAPLPDSISGFPLHKKYNTMTCAEADEDSPCPIRTIYKIDLGFGEEITIVAFKGMLKVQVDAALAVTDAVGLMGTSGKPGLVARNGTTISEPTAMGQEWQVQAGHPMLFHSDRAPQFPQACILPTLSSSRRLAENAAMHQLAEEACEGVADEELKTVCIFDVQNTGDVDLALEFLEPNGVE